MKKTRPGKLVIDRTTIRVLSDRALGGVEGGWFTTWAVAESNKNNCCSKLGSGCSAGLP